MRLFWQLVLVGIGVGLLSPSQVVLGTVPQLQSSFSGVKAGGIKAQTPGKPPNPSSQAAPCPQKAALSRLVQHQIQPGETLEHLARRYNLLPTTLMGLNAHLRSGQAPVGTKMVVPPYNGIVVTVPPGQTLKDLAAAYRVRADVLFEVNGCQPSPSLAFIPGVNWSPVANPGQTVSLGAPRPQSQPFRYPLPAPVPVLVGYGWHVDPQIQRVVFHSGVALQAAPGTSVAAAAAGTVAFAGRQGDYGNLVVINHRDGYQTRYAQLEKLLVTQGQGVQAGAILGTVAARRGSQAPHLHFEVRRNSPVGWVAQDPALHFPEIRF
jgi:murein DD-endopeptidase MepM/ murein hydrolase activator NlpD